MTVYDGRLDDVTVSPGNHESGESEVWADNSL